MNVQIQLNNERPGYFTVIPHGPIDSDTYLEFQEKVNPLLAKTTAGIVLDLADVDYISSAGLGVLFTVKKFLLAQKGDLVFCNLKPQIKRLFEIVNALPKETLFKDQEEADQYLYRMMQKEMEKEKGGE